MLGVILMGKSTCGNAESLEKKQRISVEFLKPTNHQLRDKVMRAKDKLSTGMFVGTFWHNLDGPFMAHTVLCH